MNTKKAIDILDVLIYKKNIDAKEKEAIIYITDLVRRRHSDGLQKCVQNRTDCVSNKLGYCTVLEDTEFEYDCPFFKGGKK